MKVKNYIKFLKTLDQEKEIWVNYDDIDIISPARIRIQEFDSKGVQEGDYIIDADTSYTEPKDYLNYGKEELQ